MSFFYSAVWGRGRREEGDRTRVHVSISCAEHHESNQRFNSGVFWTSGSWGPWQLYSLGRRAERQHLSKMSPAIPFLWLPTALTMGVYSFETKYNFRNRCKSRKALITIQAIWHANWCCGVSSAKMQILSWVHPGACIRICFWENLDAWLCYFVVFKLRVQVEMKNTLMAGFKQEKFFYPSRANWEVNHAEVS